MWLGLIHVGARAVCCLRSLVVVDVVCVLCTHTHTRYVRGSFTLRLFYVRSVVGYYHVTHTFPTFPPPLRCCCCSPVVVDLLIYVTDLLFPLIVDGIVVVTVVLPVVPHVPFTVRTPLILITGCYFTQILPQLITFVRYVYVYLRLRYFYVTVTTFVDSGLLI